MLLLSYQLGTEIIAMTPRFETDENLLAQNLNLLIEAADTISYTPEFSRCIPACSEWGRWPVGEKDLPLGVLVRHWVSGEFVLEHPENGNDIYVYASIGSALSGRGSFRGVVRHSRELVRGNTDEGVFARTGIMRPLSDAWLEYRKTPAPRLPVTSLAFDKVISALRQRVRSTKS